MRVWLTWSQSQRVEGMAYGGRGQPSAWLTAPGLRGQEALWALRMALKADTARKWPGACKGLTALSLMVAYTKTDFGHLNSGTL